MMKLGFYREAKKEFQEAARRYESQRAGPGIRFRREVESTTARIESNPEGFGFVECYKRLHKVDHFLTESSIRFFQKKF
jgi:hypothetical protein